MTIVWKLIIANWKLLKPGLLIALAFLTTNLLTLPRYGLFWDHFFHLNAGLKFLHIPPPHPTNLDGQPYGPLSAIPGAFTYHLLYQKFHLLPPDVAYNIPNVLAGSLGVFALYLFALEIFHSTYLASITSLTLALYPRFLGHSHVNPKDPLVSSLICLSIYFLYKWIVGTTTHHPKQSQLPLSQKFMRLAASGSGSALLQSDTHTSSKSTFLRQVTQPVLSIYHNLRSWIPFSHQFTQPAAGNLSIKKSVTHAGEYTDNGQRRTPSIRRAWPIIGGEKNGIKSVRLLIISSLTTALAFNTKINAILIPPIILSWLLLLFIFHRRSGNGRLSGSWSQMFVYPQKFHQKFYERFLEFSYWLLAIGTWILCSFFLSLLFWVFFWPDPWTQLRNLFTFFSQATHGYYLLNWGSLIQSNISMPWYYPLQMLLLTTPALMSFLATIGLTKCTSDTLRSRTLHPPLLLAWFAIPILKYLSPRVGFSDDTRHFMEIFYPLAIFTTIGLAQIRRLLPGIISHLLPPLFLIYLLLQSLPLIPYEISYYTDAIGGTRGANTLFDIDQFGLSLKAAVKYVNTVAPPNATVYIPLAAASARPYMRPDLILIPDFITLFRGEPSLTAADYVVIVNHPSLFTNYDPGILSYLSSRQPSYTISRSPTPFAWVFEN